jgi:hypothetical protein
MAVRSRAAGAVVVGLTRHGRRRAGQRWRVGSGCRAQPVHSPEIAGTLFKGESAPGCRSSRPPDRDAVVRPWVQDSSLRSPRRYPVLHDRAFGCIASQRHLVTAGPSLWTCMGVQGDGQPCLRGVSTPYVWADPACMTSNSAWRWRASSTAP